MKESKITWEVPCAREGKCPEQSWFRALRAVLLQSQDELSVFLGAVEPRGALIWALGTRGDDPWAAGSINPGRQSLLLSCAPLPLPGQLSGSVSDRDVFSGNGTGELQNASGVS